jgi:hypothetical protein
VKTGNPSACAVVNWIVYKSAIALYFLYSNVIKRDCNEGATNPIIRTRTSHSRRANHPIRDNIFGEMYYVGPK